MTAADAVPAPEPPPDDPGVCPHPIRVDGPEHSWVFDGDDPYIVCAGCDEMRDALTGRVVRRG